MKHLLTNTLIALGLLVFVFSSQAQNITSSGNLTLDGWKPPYASASEATPSINSISLRYKFIPTEKHCKLTTSVQWYIGNEVKYDGKIFKTPTIQSSHLDLFSIVTLTLRAHARVGGESLANIEIEIPNTPSSGGQWGSESTVEIPWHLLFIGKSGEDAKVIANEKVSLNTLSIKKIEFGGGSSFRQRAFDYFMEKANDEIDTGNNREAIQWLNNAINLDPQAPAPRRQREVIQRQLGAFTDLERRGNRLYREGRFFEAWEAYLQADKLMPNQLQNPERIAEIEGRIAEFKRLDFEARVLLERGQNVQDFLSARERFIAAGEFLPGRGNYIDEQVAGINRFLRETYDDLLNEGQAQMGQRAYTEAVQSFYQASQIFPNRREPQNLIGNVENILIKEIQGHYEQDKQEAERARLVALDNAAKVVYQSSEQCYLSQAEYQDCMSNFYQQQQKKADREMRGMLYGERYQTDGMICRSVTCPLENDANPDAVALLEAAKRKHKLFKQYQHQAFATFRNNFLEDALQRNSCFAEAYYFKSQLAESPMEEMKLLNSALECNPNYAEAKNRKENLNSDFSKEFYKKIADGDINYLEEALANNFIASVNDYQGYGPMEYAVVKNQMVSLDFFFRNISSLPARAMSNPSQLAYLAAENSVEDVLRSLLFQHNADANFSPVGKPSMLFLALQKRNTSILQLVLDAGASPEQINNQGINALQKSLNDRNESAFKILLPFYKIDRLSNQLLQTAIQQGSNSITQSLIEMGMNFKSNLPNGLTPIHFAIQRGTTFIVQYLIQKGIDINTVDAQSNSLLMSAIKNKKEDIAIYLLNNYADITLKNNTGEDAMNIALANRTHSVAKKLLSSGADIDKIISELNFKNDDYKKATMLALGDYAISSGQAQVLKEALKIDKEAGFYQLPSDITIIETAAKSGAGDMVVLLAESAPKVETPSKGLSGLHLAAKYNLENSLEALNDIYDINIRDYDLNTPLHQAISANNVDIIQKLMRMGANPKLKNEQGWNAKKMANKLGFKHLKKYL